MPTTPPKASLGLVVAMFAVLGLLAIGGAGWFAWRRFILPKSPQLLVQRADAGDLSALATLGISHIRGEWGVELDFEKGRAMVERAAEGGDPCGLLASGLLRMEGLAGADQHGNLRAASRAIWREALDKGALAVVAERDDPRWIALAVFAEKETHGVVPGSSRQLLERAIDAGYPNAALVMSHLVESSEEKTRWLIEAERLSRKDSRKGSVNAMRILGNLHTSGEVPDADPHYGEDMLEKAAERGDPFAALQLASYLLEEEKGGKAITYAKTAWKAGLAPAAAILGEIYFDGKGVGRDPAKATRFATEAANVGYTRGLAILARAHATGEGAALDPRKSERIWRDLIDAGFSAFNAELGRHLVEQGRATEAIGPLREAARSGHAESAMTLGKVLAETASGEDVLAEAVSWLEKAAEEDIPGAAIALAETIDHPDREQRDPVRAAALLRDLADQGDQRCAVRLAHMHIEGRGVAKDPTKAMLLLTKAAEAGESSAYFPLAEFHETGAGTLPASPAAALGYYRKALAAGDPRLTERFPGLESGRSAIAAFVGSWSDDDPRPSLAWIGEEVSEYFHLPRPDATQIASLEEGFRTLWPSRQVSSGRIEVTELKALDSLVFRVPYRLDFSRQGRAGSVTATASVEMIFPKGGSPRIVRFSEAVGEWRLEPSQDLFDRGGNRANTRGILPFVPPDESEVDFANLPRKDVESVRAIPFRDKFGGQHAMLPVSVDDGIVSFARLSGGGELLMPESYFDADVRQRLERTADGQSFADFDRWRAGLVLSPDLEDPATAELLRRAQGGDHEAEALVGEHFYDGLGTFPKNRVEAGKWFARSANGKHLLGQVWVAILTRDGEFGSDVPARDHFLGLVYQMSEAINISSRKVVYIRAAAECHAGAYGDDPSDNRMALGLLEQASVGGDPRAKVLLAKHHLRTSPTLAVGPLRSAADNRCATAATELAKYYLGPGKDLRLVSNLLRLAANKGDIEAQSILGEFLALGGEGEGRELEASFWLELALNNAVAANRKQREAEVRATIRNLANRIGEDYFRRSRSFLEKNPSTVVRSR